MHPTSIKLLWLWCRLAAAAPIRPLAWELPYATDAAKKRDKSETTIKMTQNHNVEERGQI